MQVKTGKVVREIHYLAVERGEGTVAEFSVAQDLEGSGWIVWDELGYPPTFVRRFETRAAAAAFAIAEAEKYVTFES
jgi:hypothetical protein